MELKDKINGLILFADTVAITYVFQKNKKKMISVTQPRSGKRICPVVIWAKIVLRILKYKGTSETTKVNTVKIGKKLYCIKRDDMLTQIRHTVNNMSNLGFTGSDVGTHSIRSSLAMSLYLAKRPITTIRLLGRWSSDAFLLYIWTQVQDFPKGVSTDMVANDPFFTILDLEEGDLNDPRTRNTISLNGPHAVTSHVKRPALHVWH